MIDVQVVLGTLMPRNGDHPIQIIPSYGKLRRHRRRFSELVKLLHRLRFDFLRHFGRLHLIFQLGKFRRSLVVSQLVLQDFDLFLNKIFALRFLNVVLNLRIDITLYLQDIDFCRQNFGKVVQLIAQVRRL